MTFNITVPVKIKPFIVPYHVVDEDDLDKMFELKDIEADVLAALCDKFRKDVFLRAKKKDPSKK